MDPKQDFWTPSVTARLKSPGLVRPPSDERTETECDSDKSESVQQYIERLLQISSQQDRQRKRVRVSVPSFRQNVLIEKFNPEEAGPVKRAILAERLEKLIYADDAEADSLTDGDIIGLQMLALSGLQEENNDLIERVAQLQEEQQTLLKLNREQTAKRLEFLNEFVRRKGHDLKAHGEFLIQMSHGATADDCQTENGLAK